MVKELMLVENKGRKISRAKLEECIKKRYRHSVFEYWDVFIHAMLEMLKEGRLTEEMIEAFQAEPDMGVRIKDEKTMYGYINDILDMYSEIEGKFYEALAKRIASGELPHSKVAFWKGRFLEDLVYESLEKVLEEYRELGRDIFVLPIYKIRTRPGTEDSNRGRKSDADKIADILIIDWSDKTLIAIELKNFWEHYSGKYDVEGQAEKLMVTLSHEGVDIILSKVNDGIIPGKKQRKYSKNLIEIAWALFCENKADLQHKMNVEALKYGSGFRKVYIWFHAGKTGR